MTDCPAKIRPMTAQVEINCERKAHSDLQHRGTLRDFAYPGSATTITWMDTDRRNFTGEFIECPQLGCVLPWGHRGEHAL